MASGNLGDLFVSLGIKDEMSATLRKIVNGMKGVDQATLDAKKRGEDLIKSLNGINGSNFLKVFRDATKYIEDNSKGLANIISLLKKAEDKADSNAIASKFFGAKDLPRIAEYLTAINSEFAKMSKDEARADSIKAWQSRISNSLEYIKVLQDIDLWQNKIDSTRSRNPNVNSKELDAAEKSLANIRSQIVGLLSSGGIDTSGVLGSINKLLSIAKRDVSGIISKFKEENPLSVFSGGAAKVEADIARVTEKLAKMRDLMSEGTTKGYSTSMLGGNITELNNLLQRLQSALSNKSMLTDAGQMKNLLSDVALGMTKASAATQAYGREKGKVIAQEREHNKELAKLEQQESRARSIAETISKVDRKIREFGETRDVSINLGASTTNIDGAIAKLSDLRSKLDVVDTSSKKDVANLISEYKILSNEIGNTKSKQDSLNRSLEALGNKNAAKATREQNAAEKQRQSELENSLRRIQSMEKALANLQEKRFTSKMFGFDTTEADAKILAMKVHLNELYDIMQRLDRKDMTAVGMLGNLGNGRETQAANNLAQSYDKANKEAQRGVDIEQKRQQEIAKSAAKARNDLASAFAGANAEARKMQSIVGDIKSLFLQGGIVFGAQQFFNSIVQTGGEIVQQHIALRSILGDVQKADELFNQTQQLALQSPFKFGELNRDVKQLAAFGVEANDLYETTKRLADIASGLGVDFGRLGLAFGQVKARSWLDGKELRQFAYAGLPLLQRITEMYNREGKNGKNNYTEADVKKMISARGVSFNDVQKVLWEMTDEGGQFYNMQLVLSETLLGRWNKLIDAWDIMLGKFADGKGIIGGTFSFAINRVTDLILALDKLSPAVMSFGAIFAARKLAGFASSKLTVGSMKNDYASQINTQLRSYAIKQQELVVEGKISQAIAAQNVQKQAYMLADANSLKASFSRMALEGKMSILQMQRAKREGLIEAGLVEELATMGLITAKQEQIILNGGRTAAVFNMAGTKLSGLFNMLGGWWGIGITAISSLVMAVSQYSSKIEQETKNMTDSARQNAKRIDDFLASAGAKPTDREGLKKDIDGMKDLLEQSNLYTDTIKEQVERSGDLAKQYDILKEKVIEARKATKFDEQFADTAVNAVARSGQSMMVGETLNESGLGKGWFADTLGVLSGLFNDDLETNANELAESLNRVSLSLSTAFDENQRKKIEAVADSMLPAADRTKSLEEKIATLRDKGGNDWDNFVSRVASGDKDIEKHLENVGDASKGMMSDLNEIAEDDVPKMIAYLQQSLHLYGKDFEDWCKRNPHKYAQMWDDMLAVAKVKAPAIADIIKRLAMSAVGIVSTDDRKGGGKKTYNSGIDTDFASVIRDRLFKNGTLTGKKKKGKFWVREVDSYLRQVQDDSWQKTGENVQTKLKAARNELDMLDTGKADKNSKHYKNAQHEYSIWKAIADAGNISDDLGKNKTTGNFGKDGKNGRQEDSELKALQERLSSLKSARQMYQKYKPYMSDDEAKKRTYKSFPNVVGLDLDNYENAVNSLIKSSKFKATTSERKKFLTSVNREKAEWKWDEVEKPGIEVLASERNAYMDRLSSRWDLYKTLLEKTGNKRYAEAAWIDAFQMDDKSKSLMNLYYQNFGKQFNAQEALNMSDEEAKKTFKSADEYNEWKKIVELLRNNYVQSLQDGADAMQQTMSVAQKIDAITEKYAKKRKDAGANQDLIDRYDFLERQEKSSVLLDQMKNEINWDGVFGNLGNYTKKELKKVRKDINSLISGGILNGMSTTDIKSVYEGLGKLNQTIDGEGFSGLSDLLKDLVDASEKYDEAVKEYNKSVKEYGPDSWKTEQARKSMQQAEQRKRNAQGNVDTKKGTILGNVSTIVGMLNTLGLSDGSGSTLLRNAGGWTESIMKMFGASDKNSSKVGGFVGMFAGLTEAISEKGFGGFLSDAFEDIGGAVTSIFKDIFGINLGLGGADYSSYNKAKAEYENLTSVWDSLISKKTEYMNIHWGSEATEASKEAQRMLEAEVEQTRIIAQKRLDAGASAGSHSIKHRMWKGSYKYNGQNWRDVAGEISSKYGVQFNGMEDMLNMNADTLSKIKQDYTGLWATMDSDFRDYLEKLIEYGDKADEMVENLTEKLTGNKFSSLVESWGDAMAQMSNSSDSLVDNFENNLKKTIVNSMIENLYKDKINKILDKAKKYGDKDLSANITDANGNIISTFTGSEYSEVMGDVEDVSKQIEATRDFLKKTYGWSDNSSSSSTNSVKGITEETADILVSYANAIRLDCSVMRAEQAKYFPEMSEIAKSQLTQLNMISQNTLRNADAAERIETIFISFNDNFNKVLNGTKKLNVK